DYGWVERASGSLARALAEALERPDAQEALAEMIDDLIARYRERTAFYPRLALGLADLLGLIGRRPIVAALRAGLAEAGRDLARRPPRAVARGARRGRRAQGRHRSLGQGARARAARPLPRPHRGADRAGRARARA